MKASFPGPDPLGRGLVIRTGQPVPPAFATAPRVRVDEAALARPDSAIGALHQAWSQRRRVVVELGVEPSVLKAPEETSEPPFELAPGFEFKRERLHFLVWANTYDATRGEPVWWYGRLAEKLGAQAWSPEDVRLPSGEVAWCDGGPREALPLAVVHRESLDVGRLTLQVPHGAVGSELAQDQLAAVVHGAGPARIIAPAGSGKTRVLTERLRHLLVDRGYERDLITAVAYNRRAADELKQRTAAFSPRVQTLHALGYAILNRLGRREVLGEYEVRQLLRGLVTIDPQPNQDPLAAYLEALAQVRIGLVRPEVVDRERDDVSDFVRVFRRYRSHLAEMRAVDHDEQIYGAIEVLLSQPEERKYWQRQCRHLLVDEFQDLTPAYLLMIRLLAAPAYQVFGVGDDDQVIYGYVGASPDYLIRYDQYFPGATAYALKTNYRCPAPVVQAASTLLLHNKRRVSKDIRHGPAALADGMGVEQHESGALAEQAVARVQAWLAAGVEAHDIAVLTRVNSSLLPVQICLGDAGVPCRTAVNATLLSRTGIRTAMSYLRLAVSYPNLSREDVAETIRRPARKIGRSVNDMISHRAQWNARDLHKAADRLQRWEQERFDDYLEDLKRLAEAARGRTTRQVLQFLRTQIGLDSALSTLDGSSQNAWTASHVDDLKVLEQVAALHPQVAGFETWLTERLSQQGKAGVTLSTIHRVKGMEWPCVVLLDASDGLMPHRLAADLEEERRVFHVGITRARQHLVVLSDKAFPSVFLQDLRQAPGPARPSPAPSRKAPTGIAAAVGLEMAALGTRGVISDVYEDFVLMKVPEGGRVTVRFGERVQAGGESGLLVRGTVPAAVDGETVEALVEGLRQWRREVADEKSIPPYVVLHDKHVKAIAERAPRTLEALSRCKGMGPARLEAYGDQILGRIEEIVQLVAAANSGGGR